MKAGEVTGRSERSPKSLIDGAQLGLRVHPEIRSSMSQALRSQQKPQTAIPSSFAPSGLPAYFSSLAPILVNIKSQILQELEQNLLKLLTLNPSRRDSVAQHLDRLAGLSSSPSHGLRRWIEGPRSPAQNSALQGYFEEIALVVLGKTILLKAWSDRGIRRWTAADLRNLNYALDTALKPYVPLDREGWQITRQNLYSWYSPGVSIQQEIWSRMEHWRITDEGSGFLLALLTPLRQAFPEFFQPQGYDSRFFQAIWKMSPEFGFDLSLQSGPSRPIWKVPSVFSPTLRDGAMVRTGPTSVSWVGLESSQFQLLMAELVQLWWGPSAPPLWTTGTGLEVHSRDQLALGLAATQPKPTLLARISEMEAFEAAFVLEEQIIRGQARAPEALRFKEQVDALPYFKKLRKPGTTLGDLQACVALSKLRPGGVLWWAREEALSAADGEESLGFLLERAKIICEWDFSELDQAIPTTVPLFPNHLYLLSREIRVEERLTHRPLRVVIRGQLRSHVEVPLLLEAALNAAAKAGEQSTQAGGGWEITVLRSPTPQKDWGEHWPDPACQTTMRVLDQLRSVSAPLAQVTTVRPTPEGDPTQDYAWSVPSGLHGIWLDQEYQEFADGTKERILSPRPLPRPGREARGKQGKGTGFLVMVADETWIAPLSVYLRSPEVKKWLDHHAERRGDRWVLDEQIVKWIPIPKTLLRVLGWLGGAKGDAEPGAVPFAVPLPGEWEQIAAEVGYQPKRAREALVRLGNSASKVDDNTLQRIRAALFVRASRALDQLRAGQDHLSAVVSEDGKIKWQGILDILPKTEFVPVSLHPKVKISGNLPPHIPVARMDRVKIPTPGILLSTELGFTLHLGSDSSLVLELLWEQLEGMAHPTWNELVQYLRLPRRVEFAEATASDVLKSHGEQALRIRELHELISICTLF